MSKADNSSKAPEPPGDHDAPGWRNVQNRIRLIPSGDGLAQLRYAPGSGYTRFCPRKALSAAADGRGSGEIGLADFHVDDVTT